MNLPETDWDYIRCGGDLRKKPERFAEIWVKRGASLKLLERILLQPAMNENRIASKIQESAMGHTESLKCSLEHSMEWEPTGKHGHQITKQAAFCVLTCFLIILKHILKRRKYVYSFSDFNGNRVNKILIS